MVMSLWDWDEEKEHISVLLPAKWKSFGKERQKIDFKGKEEPILR